MRLFSLNPTRRRALLGTSLLLGVVAACSTESIRPIGLPAGKAVVAASNPAQPADERKPNSAGSSDPTGTPKTNEDATVQQPPPEPVTYNIVDLTSSERKRKTAEQLQKSLILCLGAESQASPAPGGSASPENFNADFVNPPILKVSADMIISTSAAVSPDRPRFLLNDSNRPKADKSIIELERAFLDSSAVSTGTYADTLEDVVYLNSLLTVASVAAFNCDVRTASNTNCNCSTREAATAMLQRCLPLVDPITDAFKEAVEKLYSPENCGAPDTNTEGLLKRRRAIASLLSSYAFATAK